MVSNLILRTLKLARYESENKGHFGIASKYYCHFTSPIRRYNEQANRYAKNSSECEKIAQKVERDAEDIKKAEFMQNKIGEEYDGIISSVTSFGIFVELENTVEGLIRFDDLEDDYFIYDEQRKILQGERTKKTYKIGDKIRIKVKYADKLSRRIDFEKVFEEKSRRTKKT